MRWLIVLLAGLLASPAFASDYLVLPKQPFSATAIHVAGPYLTRETIHYADGKLRIDRADGFATTILDLNTQTECILMANHTYLVLPMDNELYRRFFPRDPRYTNAHAIGPANLNGVRTTKYAFGDDDGLKAAGFYWISSNGIMLRRDYQEGLFGENLHQLDTIQNVSIGPQPKSLFQIPAGYRRVK